MVADFGNKRFFILYGPGGVGKSSVISIICSVSSNEKVTLASSFIAKRRDGAKNYSNTMPLDTLGKISCSKLVHIPDVELSKDEELNMQTVKLITGGDQSDYGKVSVTMVTSANVLPNYAKMSDYTRPDRTRRVTVVPTVMKRNTEEAIFKDPDNDTKLRLLSHCIATRIKYDLKPPLSPRALLMTLFQDKFKTALSMVRIDEDSSLLECYIATRALCHRFGIYEGTMQDCLRTVGSCCCVIFCDVYVMKSISLKFKVKVPSGYENIAYTANKQFVKKEGAWA